MTEIWTCKKIFPLQQQQKSVVLKTKLKKVIFSKKRMVCEPEKNTLI